MVEPIPLVRVVSGGRERSGHTNITLNACGRRQADLLARALRDEPIAAFYASDLSRAFETAQAVARPRGQSVLTYTGLRERCFGRFEGQTWAELEVRWPGASACPTLRRPVASCCCNCANA